MKIINYNDIIINPLTYSHHIIINARTNLLILKINNNDIHFKQKLYKATQIITYNYMIRTIKCNLSRHK